MAGYPVVVSNVLNLTDMGLKEKCFRFGTLSMESDKFISVKDETTDGAGHQVVVIDMHNNFNVTRKPMKAEGSLMNTVDNIIALKGKADGAGGHFIQIFNLDNKEKMGVHTFTEDVVFWKWITPRILAVVTMRSVFHWDLKTAGPGVDPPPPEKIFDRQAKLAESSTQIISYSVDGDLKWCLLTGIYTPDQGVTINGAMQLYSISKAQQQILEGHAGCFGSLITDDSGNPKGVVCFAERKKDTPTNSRLHVMDIHAQRGEGQPPPFKVTATIQYPAETPNDFPIALHLSEKYGVLMMASKGGLLFCFDAATGSLLFREKFAQDTIFVACASEKTGGLLAVTRKGAVMSACINEQELFNYICTQLPHLANSRNIAMGLVTRYGLPGADDILINQFNGQFGRGDYKAAAKTVAMMKSGALRTPATIAQFKGVQPTPGQSMPILMYFSTLLEHGKLTSLESLELVRPVVAQNRREFVEKWLTEDKLTCSEELGDVIRQIDQNLALTVYQKAHASNKVVELMASTGQYDKIAAYASSTNYKADYTQLLTSMLTRGSPEQAVTFCRQLLSNDPPSVDINQVVATFTAQGRVSELTSILLDALKNNKPDEGHLQTKLLEINLQSNTQVAETIFQMNAHSHFDRPHIAHLCEKAGLYQRALENYAEITDIKRVMMLSGGSGQLNPQWLTTFLEKQSPEVRLEVLSDILRNNRQTGGVQVVVQAAIKVSASVGAEPFIQMFESQGAWEGLFYYLGALLATSEDPEVHFKYIEAAAKLNHMQEVDRVCRTSTKYDPVRVKEFLKSAKLTDPRPLIHVCDQHGFVGELVEYLYRQSLIKYIEVYVTRQSPHQTPAVIGTLLDLDGSEDFIKSLLQSVRGACPVGPLVEEVEKRNRLKLLMSWLEARLSEGNQEVELHNALAKLYIDTNREPEDFLKTNRFYDSAAVGKYCEERDPHLAFTAYKRAWGVCDERLLHVTNKNGLFRLQARYLVERQDASLWGQALDPANHHRRSVIDQVVATALPESTNPDEVSAAVKAFIAASLPKELIELLEKIVLHNSDFSRNKNLQNLLILTAIKADTTRLIDYINRLDNYDGPEIAKVAIQYKLYEVGFIIYKKFELNSEAIETLLLQCEEHKESGDNNEAVRWLERASEFAARCNQTDVWAKLGRIQLKLGKVSEATESFLKGGEAGDYREVIEAAKEHGRYEELVSYLTMARKKAGVRERDHTIDTELTYALAKCDRLPEMEEFVSGTNTANVASIGERLFDEGLFKAARILFASIPNYPKLASCHIQLQEWGSAVDAAKKANSPVSWREVNFACLKAEEFKCAHVVGVHLICYPDHLDELISEYEKSQYIDELLALLEAGVGGERAHVGLYTELAVLYAKYRPDKLTEYTHSNTPRLNIPKLIRACERHHLWSEAVHLHIAYDEYDDAAHTIIQHGCSCWEHDLFVRVMMKVANVELFYIATDFYLEYHPMELNKLLTAISNKIDHARIVQQMRKANKVALVHPFFQQVQHNNVLAVNEALNEFYLATDDHNSLRESISEYDNIDQIGLAEKLEEHERVEMRRISCLLYKKNKRFEQSIKLSQKDSNHRDAIETARDSQNIQMVEDLLRFFVDKRDPDCFCASLYVCYSLVRPDVAMELAWRNGYIDQVMPYLLQTMKEYSYRVDMLDKKVEHREKEEEKEKSAPNDFVADYIMSSGPRLQGMGNLALMGPGGGMGGTGTPPGGMGGLGGNLSGGTGMPPMPFHPGQP
eukprot:GHVN01050942.1.p1 GENE.GHVN01050942.1~~GHVN01050942.1.p1  ORF type:complete len:1744 (+),score=313.50 GHVN01050942.1:122-5353(+)